MSKATLMGFFRPQHPEKYKGDPRGIVYRSSYELKMMLFLDKHPDVIQWASEEFCVLYTDPIEGKKRRYFPDFWVKKKNKNGEEEIVVIEVKPYVQTLEPKPQTKITKRYLHEVKTWAVNQNKWKAAKVLCDKKGWKFQLITEHDLGMHK